MKILDITDFMSRTGPPYGFPPQTSLSKFSGLKYECGCGIKHTFSLNEITVARELQGKKFVFIREECKFLTLVEVVGFLSKEFKTHYSSQSEVEDDISVHEMSEGEDYEMTKEFVKLHGTFYRIAEILVIRSSIYFVTNEFKLRDKVILAIFYDCLITIMFNKFGKEKEREVMLEVLSFHESIDVGNISFSAEHINIARKLVQLEKDATAIKVATSAANLWSDIDNISKNEAALYDILVDKSIDWAESSLVVENVKENEDDIENTTSPEKLKLDKQETLGELEQEDKSIKTTISEEKKRIEYKNKEKSDSNKPIKIKFNDKGKQVIIEDDYIAWENDIIGSEIGKQWEIFIKYRPEVKPMADKLLNYKKIYLEEFIQKILEVDSKERTLKHIERIFGEVEDKFYLNNINNFFVREDLNKLNTEFYESYPDFSKKLVEIIKLTGENVNIDSLKKHIKSNSNYVLISSSDRRIKDVWNLILTFSNNVENCFQKILDVDTKYLIKNYDPNLFVNLEWHKKKLSQKIFDKYIKHKDASKYNDVANIKYIYARQFISQIVALKPNKRTNENIRNIFEEIIFWMLKNDSAEIYERSELNILNKKVCNISEKLYLKLKEIIDITGENVDIETLKKDLNI